MVGTFLAESFIWMDVWELNPEIVETFLAESFICMDVWELDPEMV
jgi:hypothetical protein